MSELVPIVLTEEQSRRVRRRVEEGFYGSTEDVMELALRLYEEREAQLDSQREQIAEGLADLDAGRVTAGPAFMCGLASGDFDGDVGAAAGPEERKRSA